MISAMPTQTVARMRSPRVNPQGSNFVRERDSCQRVPINRGGTRAHMELWRAGVGMRATSTMEPVMVAIARHSIGRSFLWGLFAALAACSSEATDPEQFPTTPGGGGSSQIAGVPAGWAGGAVLPSEYAIVRDVQVGHGG